MIWLNGGHEAIFPAPAQAFLGLPARSIFRPDPALVAESVDRREHARVIDLALIRLVPTRHRGALQVADERQVLLEAVQQIAADDLHVIEIELDLHVRLAELGDNVGGVLDAVEIIIRPVARVDRLDLYVDALGTGEISRHPQIVDKDALRRRTLVDFDFAGEAMHRAAADGRDVIERAAE